MLDIGACAYPSRAENVGYDTPGSSRRSLLYFRRRDVVPVGRARRLGARVARRQCRATTTSFRRNAIIADSGRAAFRPGVARYGSFMGRGSILMPGFVNIGAYVDEGSMVDTWATVGSCAQIGKDVHLAGGVGIGGVLEPPQAQPVIVEDGAFIGSRCIVVEGVFVGREAVLGAGSICHREHADRRRARLEAEDHARTDRAACRS